MILEVLESFEYLEQNAHEDYGGDEKSECLDKPSHPVEIVWQTHHLHRFL